MTMFWKLLTFVGVLAMFSWMAAACYVGYLAMSTR